MSPDYDVIVIGSGFGGSVTALRLSEKGYRVGVLEKGARWRPEDYPPNNWHFRKSLWHPHFGLIGPHADHRIEERLYSIGCRRGWGFVDLRQHPLRAARTVLQRSAVGIDHGLEGRIGAVLRPGQAHARRRDQSDD